MSNIINRYLTVIPGSTELTPVGFCGADHDSIAGARYNAMKQYGGRYWFVWDLVNNTEVSNSLNTPME